MSDQFNSYLCSRFPHYICASSKHDDTTTLSTTELDSHADSPVVGKYCKILELTGKTVKVSGFTSDLGQPLEVPVVNAAVAYDCIYTGMTYILVIYNALYFRNMEVNLIPPFMMRLAGLQVDECPKFLAIKPTVETHSLYFPAEDLRFPFQIEGIVSYLPTRKPDDEEIEKYRGAYLLLTPNSSTWNPHSSTYRDQEHGMLDYRGEIKAKRQMDRQWIGAVANQSICDPVHEPELFIASVVSRIDVGDFGLQVSGVTSGKRKGVDAKTLSKRWRIPLEMARRTIEATTQLAVRSVDVPSLSRRFRTNDRMLRYIRVSSDVFMDTFFASKKSGKSARGYTCCQVFATEFGHVIPVLMQGKVELPKALKKYFKDVGVPPNIICDGAREQVQGASLILCHDSGCQVVELEKGTPNANRAERYIQMLKTKRHERDWKSSVSMVLLYQTSCKDNKFCC